MTFTVVGRCKRTGHLGIGIATSSPAVVNRCVNVSRDGAVAFQSVPDPRLGALGLRLVESGWWPDKVVAELVSTDKWPGKRQIGVVNGDGHAAAFTGDDNIAWAGHIIGDNHVAMGNVLAGPEVAQAISEEFLATAELDLEDRLLRAIEAGRDAGGQEEGQTSAGILVFGKESYSRCDLRVDVAEEPVAELRRIFDWYKPLIPYYVERARNPLVPRAKDYLAHHGVEREFGKPVPVSRGPKAKHAPAPTSYPQKGKP
ncbi:MAG TPA: DUF1028 domain-containing protein [Casimicrobiaceae bacterium]|nr:DUF1028 domain-containing protein [Casimicrobiaceae bacterium]